MIEEIGTWIHRFRAVKPCKKQFFVDLTPQFDTIDSPVSEDLQDYRRLCEESGWTFITANEEIHVFSADTSLPPLHTDDGVQMLNYLKADNLFRPSAYKIYLLAFFFSQIILLFGGMGVDLFLSNIMIFQILGGFFLSWGAFWMIGLYYDVVLSNKKGRPKEFATPHSQLSPRAGANKDIRTWSFCLSSLHSYRNSLRNH